jgi:hypothetical protein
MIRRGWGESSSDFRKTGFKTMVNFDFSQKPFLTKIPKETLSNSPSDPWSQPVFKMQDFVRKY